MKPIVFTPFFVMCFSSAAAMRSSFCVVLNTQRLLASSGSTTDDVPTVAITGTFASAMTSRIASALGVVDGPIIASMLYSWISFLMFCTARVVSPPSSSWMYSTVASPIFLGSRSPVFFCGMPMAVVGPVAETMRPTLTCATASDESPTSRQASARRWNTWNSFGCVNVRCGTRRAAVRRIAPAACPDAHAHWKL